MKLIAALVVIALISSGTYYLVLNISNRKKAKKMGRSKALTAGVSIGLILLVFLGSILYQDSKAPDIYCGKPHSATSQPPVTLKSATDFYNQGNYDFETGDCQKSIGDYSQSILLDPTYPQAYNNRAYANMRLRNYSAALPDLDNAIELKPDYIQALMNRGDIHNYYYQIDRSAAIKDYEKVIALGGDQQSKNVCGHLLLAKHNGWNLGTFFDLPASLLSGKCN